MALETMTLEDLGTGVWGGDERVLKKLNGIMGGAIQLSPQCEMQELLNS